MKIQARAMIVFFKGYHSEQTDSVYTIALLTQRFPSASLVLVVYQKYLNNLFVSLFVCYCFQRLVLSNTV